MLKLDVQFSGYERDRGKYARCAGSSQDGCTGYKETVLKPSGQGTAQTLQRIPVTMAKGIHLFPYRTQKLSLSAPMVLGWRRPGRVGRCRIPRERDLTDVRSLFLCDGERDSPVPIPNTEVKPLRADGTWLGSRSAALMKRPPPVAEERPLKSGAGCRQSEERPGE